MNTTELSLLRFFFKKDFFFETHAKQIHIHFFDNKKNETMRMLFDYDS